MRVSRVRYGTPHSWALIKSYELSLMGMCYVCWFPFISLCGVYMFLCISVHVMNHSALYKSSLCKWIRLFQEFKCRRNQDKPQQIHTNTHTVCCKLIKFILKRFWGQRWCAALCSASPSDAPTGVLKIPCDGCKSEHFPHSLPLSQSTSLCSSLVIPISPDEDGYGQSVIYGLKD